MLHRFPKGVERRQGASEAVPAGAPPWLDTVRLHFPRYGQHADELCVTELAEVIWAVQMSTVEFHPWNSRAPTPRSRTNGASTSTRWRSARSTRSVGWPAWRTKCSTSSVPSGGRRRRAARACTSTCASNRRYGFKDVRRAALAFAREVERRVPAMSRPHGGARTAIRRRVRRLQPERPRPHDGGGLLRAGFPERRVDADRWSEIDDVEPADLNCHRAGRFAELGDLHAGIDNAVFAIETLLEWAARDEREGAVDAGDPQDPVEDDDVPGV